MTTAIPLTECTIVRIEKEATVRALRDDPAFSEMFLAFLLARNIRIQEDLVDQLFNSSEKRLARVLLLLANFGKESTAVRATTLSCQLRFEDPSCARFQGKRVLLLVRLCFGDFQCDFAPLSLRFSAYRPFLGAQRFLITGNQWSKRWAFALALVVRLLRRFVFHNPSMHQKMRACAHPAVAPRTLSEWLSPPSRPDIAEPPTKTSARP